MGGVIQVSRLGSFGRFGNQLFQYCFAKALARERGAELQVPSTWIGRRIFHIDEPPIQAPFCNTPGCDPTLEAIPPDADLWGYFQNPEYYALYTRGDTREWLKLLPAWEFLRVPQDGIVAHWRSYQGYENSYCVVAQEAYEKAVAYYHEGETFTMVSDLHPHKDNKLSDEIGFLFDWLTCARAAVLFRGNSTFSIWAYWLGRADRVYAPVVGDMTGGPHLVPFTPGNATPILDFAKNCPGELGRVYGEYKLADE
jgi:hypothetical protein